LFHNLVAQVSSFKLNNKNYVLQDNTWYYLDEYNEKYQIDEKSITVKLRKGIPKEEILKLNKGYGIKIVLENMLGYIDLILPANVKFYEIVNIYNEKNIFESINVNGYAIPCSPLEPNDDYFYYQDYLFNYSEPYIQADEAWNIEKGNPSVVVAVIGSGVDKDNLDLGDDGIYSNLWSDGTQYGYGWDYHDEPNDNIPDPIQTNSHETTVAGVIAAKTNNSEGISGITGGWNSTGSKIMAIRLKENSTGYIASYIDDAILWAANHGAKIINMSFSHIPSTDPALDAAINYACNTKGCLLIASAGQYGATRIGWPGANEHVMAVFGVQEDYSSYGPLLGGGEIATTSQNIYTLLNATTLDPYNSSYIAYGGTTLAAAQVSGIAALILSKYPQYINYDLRKILNRSALDIGNSTDFGNGLVQAYDALLQAAPTYQAQHNQPQNVTMSGAYNSKAIISWNEVQQVVLISIIFIGQTKLMAISSTLKKLVKLLMTAQVVIVGLITI